MLVGCASLPTDFPRAPSTALSHTEQTTAGRRFAEDVARRPGQSGFVLLEQGRDAFLVRNAMTQMAEKTLDVQY